MNKLAAVLLALPAALNAQATSTIPDTLLAGVQRALERSGMGASVSTSGSVFKVAYLMPFAHGCDVKVTAHNEHRLLTDDRTVTASLRELSPDVPVKQWDGAALWLVTAVNSSGRADLRA